jgi:hypothetical protein
MTADDDLVSVTEAARLVGRSRARVFAWVKEGRVSAVQGQRGYLVHLAEVRAHVARVQEAQAALQARLAAAPPRPSRPIEQAERPAAPSATSRLLAAVQAYPEGAPASRLAWEASVPLRYAHLLLAGAVARRQVHLGHGREGQRLYAPAPPPAQSPSTAAEGAMRLAPLMRRTVALPVATVEALTVLGGGNLSEGIQRLWEAEAARLVSADDGSEG